jgi:mannose-6-phosphate isomerase-like protein (cupin superfamily)
MPQPVRRIVTENDGQGRSRVKFDGFAETTLGTLTELWVTDGTPASNTDGRDAAARPVLLEPPAKGTLFRFFEVEPESADAGLTKSEREKRVAEAFASIGASHARPDTQRHPAMHRTKTVDYIVLLSGRITLLLDDAEVDMKPFDVVVQRGTNHAWVNRGTDTARLLAVLVDAD